MWAFVIILAAAAATLGVFGGWFLAVILVLVVLTVAVGLRFAGRYGEIGRMRRFRGQAKGAGPEPGGVEFTDRDQETLAS